MSLKHRNVIAWVLLMLSAIGWAGGLRLLRYTPGAPVSDTSAVYENTSISVTWPTMEHGTDPTEITWHPTIGPTADGYVSEQTGSGLRRVAGFTLCVLAIVAAFFAIFVLRQRKAFFGPDGAAWLLVPVGLAPNLQDSTFPTDILLYGLLVLLALSAAREFWGWLGSRCSLQWCAVQRLALRSPMPQLILCGSMLLPVLVAWGLSQYLRLDRSVLGMVWLLVSVLLSALCLYGYGKALQHLRRQLDNFQKGLPITPGEGIFSETEAQLQQLQQQHEQAIRTAVTSERFKVELISNVSHDLRTPLTAILGYGELLGKEELPPAARTQLEKLNQKAGYMRDLVESLFELTKVSSGAVESKREKIDLIRLLEQTLGLYDDHLTAAGLTVRRHYGSDTIPVVTDGARMHQVFANLLGNAIKYALPGTRIHLEASVTEDGCRIRMVNIASYEMDFRPEEILQRFARGDKARSTQGSGLGLAIAQTYTESVGGSFRVEIDGDQFSAIVELPKTERNL